MGLLGKIRLGLVGLGGVTLLELLDAACAVDELLLAREKRVAAGADFDADRGFRGTRMNHVSTKASDRGFLIFGVNLIFHIYLR